MISVSHRDNIHSSLPLKCTESYNIHTNWMSPLCYLNSDDSLLSNKNWAISAATNNILMGESRMVSDDSDTSIGYDQLNSCRNGLFEHMGNIPLPQIPKELRKSLSDKMFGLRAPSSDETAVNSKQHNTHAKKSHKVRSKKVNHQCLICDKAFSRPCALKTHMYKHTGEKPYCCPIKDCMHRFSVRSNLRRHISAVHGEAKLFELDVKPTLC